MHKMDISSFITDISVHLYINFGQVANKNVIVQDSTGKEIESQLLPIVKESIAIRNYYATAYVGESPTSSPKYWLVFTATVPPLGFSSYVVTSSKQAG